MLLSILYSTRIQILLRRAGAGVVNENLAGICNSRIPRRLYYFSTSSLSSSSSFIQQYHSTIRTAVLTTSTTTSSNTTTVSHAGGSCSSCCLLHHEWIVPDSSSSSSSATRSSTVITGDVKEPIRTTPSSSSRRPVVVFLHGLLGNCKNLRTLAKRLVQETGITALLMDLRGHGQSRHCFDTTSSGNNDNDYDRNRDQRKGGHQEEQTLATMQQEDSVPLNNNNNMVTIQSCAEDVIYTLYQLNLIGENSPRGIVGHSFGGRCALAYHHHLLLRATSSDGGGGHIMGTSPNNAYLHPPQDCWILDSCPGKIHPSVRKVVEAVASIDMPIQSKKELVRILTKEKNLDPSIAAWMTTNLKSVGDATAGAGAGAGEQQQQYEFMFDLNVIHDILQDFPRQDMMRMLQECFMTGPNGSEAAAAPMRGNIHMVIASKNNSWTSDILEQLETIRQGNGFKDKNALALMQLNLLHLDAGHWVHVDALDELVVAMAKGLVKSD